MATALLSAAMERPVRADMAMTGEVDLLGTGYLAMTVDQGPDMERY